MPCMRNRPQSKAGQILWEAADREKQPDGVENFSGGSYVQKLWELKNREIQQEQKGTLNQMLAALLGKASGQCSGCFLRWLFLRGILPGNIIGRYFCHAAAVRAADGTDGHRAFEVFGNLPEELKKTGLLRKFLMLEEEEKAKDHLSGPAGRIQFDRVSFLIRRAVSRY